jgi:hypothetical protein
MLDLAGVNRIEPGVPEQLSGAPRQTLIEQDLHEAVGRSAVSSPTMAAA